MLVKKTPWLLITIVLGTFVNLGAQQNNVLIMRNSIKYDIYIKEGSSLPYLSTGNIIFYKGLPKNHYSIILKLIDLPRNWYYTVWFTDSSKVPLDSTTIVSTQHLDSIVIPFVPGEWFKVDSVYCLRVTPLGYGASNWWFSSKPIVIKEFYFSKFNYLEYLGINITFLIIVLAILVIPGLYKKSNLPALSKIALSSQTPVRLIVNFIVIYFIISWLSVHVTFNYFEVKMGLFEELKFAIKYILEALLFFCLTGGTILYVIERSENRKISRIFLDKLFLKLKEFDHGEFKYKAMVNLETLLRNYLHQDQAGGEIRNLLINSLERVLNSVVPSLEYMINLCKLLRFDKEYQIVYKKIITIEAELKRVKKSLLQLHVKILARTLTAKESVIAADELLLFRRNLKNTFSLCLGYYKTDICELAIEECRHWQESTKIDVTVECSHNHIYCIFNKNELQSVLNNLIQNSVDAILLEDKRNGQIKIKIEQLEDQVALLIIDNGGGIMVEPITKIFELGVSTKGKNRGMGLFLIKSNIENYFGTIEVISAKNSGTTFIIKLLQAEGI